jgi:hypothetical protein
MYLQHHFCFSIPHHHLIFIHLLLSSLQATPQLLQANANAGRRLLNAAQLIEPAAARVSSLNPKAYWRRLQATNSIPEITSDVAAKESVIPTVSPLLTLNDMLCAVESFSPTGLEGITMPTAAEFKSAGVTANPSSGKPITCPPLPTLGSFHHGGVVFKPVVIPVVFHCECCHLLLPRKMTHLWLLYTLVPQPTASCKVMCCSSQLLLHGLVGWYRSAHDTFPTHLLLLCCLVL